MNINGRRAYLSGIRVESHGGAGKGDILVVDVRIPIRIRDEDGQSATDDLRDWLKDELVRPQVLDPVDFGRLRELKPEEATPTQLDRLETIRRRASMAVEMVQPVPLAWSRTLRLTAEAAAADDFDEHEAGDAHDVEWDGDHPPRLFMGAAVAKPKMRVDLVGDVSASVTLRVMCRTSLVSGTSPLDIGRLQRFPVRLSLEVIGQQLALPLPRRSAPTDTPVLDSMLDGA